MADFNDILRANGVDALRDHFDRARPWEPNGDGLDVGPDLDEAETAWCDPAMLPRRDWLYGRALIRGQVSLLVAPGGVGKTAYTCTQVMALVTGKPLLHDQVWGGPKRVRLWNLEEPRDEMVRRLEAVRKRFDLGTPSGLFLTSGFDRPLCIAETTRDGARIIRPVTDALIASLKRQRIDVLIVDPFVSSHRVAENDNSGMDLVAKEWARIAHEAGCAIQLVHHTVKLHGADATVDSARGASALVGAVRIARALNPMTPEMAADYGLAEPWRYIRVDDAKANYAAKESGGQWHALASVALGNGDSVGVVERWKLPDAMDGVTVAHLDEVVRRAGKGEFREDIRCKENWIGHMIADVIGADLDDPAGKKKVKESQKAWIKSGALKVVERSDASRKTRKFVLPASPLSAAKEVFAPLAPVEKTQSGASGAAVGAPVRQLRHPLYRGGALEQRNGGGVADSIPRSEATAAAATGGGLRDQVRTILAEAAAPMSQSEVRGRLSGKPTRKAVGMVLRRMRDAGEVERVGSDLYAAVPS